MESPLNSSILFTFFFPLFLGQFSGYAREISEVLENSILYAFLCLKTAYKTVLRMALAMVLKSFHNNENIFFFISLR